MSAETPVRIASPMAVPFYTPSPWSQTPLRQAITQVWLTPEPEIMQPVMAAARLDGDLNTRAGELATRLTQELRNRKAGLGRDGLVQDLLQEYALSSQEGVALMCLAEALLRIPDQATRSALIRDKVAHGEWRTHLGSGKSLFVNAATWGLIISGKLVATHSEGGLSASLSRILSRGGEPLIRRGVDMAMRMMGEQFVMGQTIDEGLRRAEALEKQGFSYSYDMLGEAAMTAADAARYHQAYETAIDAIGKASKGRGPIEGPGISIKLSALHPRYSRAQYQRVLGELYPTLLDLCRRAKQHNIGLNIDAEEADRLELSLDLLEKLAMEPDLDGWDGLGFVVQGYQKRCPYVVDWIIDLARRSGHRIMVRLVKGAYWDSEIKLAQVEGLPGYPVYTRKPYTDAAYIMCARKLLAATDVVYPQFATHNARSLATIYELADPATYQPGQYEFQCLHGMGEPLYEQVVSPDKLDRPCRIYAPVGTHETLLAYLVRRLLENGANSSFVNQIGNADLSIDELVADPVAIIDGYTQAEGTLGLPHPGIPLPRQLYGATRVNSQGINLNKEDVLSRLTDTFRALESSWHAEPMLAVDATGDAPQPVINPALHNDQVGSVRNTTPAEVQAALQAASEHATTWAQVPPAERARLLEAVADRFEADMPNFMALAIREAGKSAANAVAEVREAVDFLRYYAHQARSQFDNATHVPLGPVVCISPWNFPLAIFTGQIAAALAAGNVVLAKPAEQTPLIAAAAVRAMLDAGIPRHAIQLLPGDGANVGGVLAADARVQGVMFTGSTEVARTLQKTLIGRVTSSGKPVPLIAETGGQNAMIVDSSALPEQVVGDVLNSAFDSAGQRCSALRILCVQEDVADRTLEMLLGGMDELRVGNPGELATDVGPVIDAQAKGNIDRHVEAMRAKGHRVHQVQRGDGEDTSTGTFVPPTLIEIDRISELGREVFGPVLHYTRYPRDELDGLMSQINGTGYGLTMGVHTRIDETIGRLTMRAQAGNIYVNRNIVGAVVGVQPFGGQGLSGTGPKAGGPLYLYRLLASHPDNVLQAAQAVSGNPTWQVAPPAAALTALATWTHGHQRQALATVCEEIAKEVPANMSTTLPGPTGEKNDYVWRPRSPILCLAASDADRLVQLAAILALGSRAIWPASAEALAAQLPASVAEHVTVVRDPLAPTVTFDAVLLHGTSDELTQVQEQLAARPGKIINVEWLPVGATNIPMERLMVEHAVSIDTTAAGGNASLMTMA